MACLAQGWSGEYLRPVALSKEIAKRSSTLKTRDFLGLFPQLTTFKRFYVGRPSSYCSTVVLRIPISNAERNNYELGSEALSRHSFVGN